MGRIVVGIDGSEQAVEALRWAIGEARLRGATIDAIDAWNYPYVVVPGAPIPLHPLPTRPTTSSGKREEAVAAVTADADGVTINSIVTEGVPAAVLCEAAEGADLLVIGHSHHRLAARTAAGLGVAGGDALRTMPGRGRTALVLRRRSPLRFDRPYSLRSAMRRVARGAPAAGRTGSPLRFDVLSGAVRGGVA